MSGWQTDQWRLPVRSSDPGLSASLAVHPPWRLRSTTAQQKTWRLAGANEGEDEKRDSTVGGATAKVLFITLCWCYTFRSEIKCFVIPPSDFKTKRDVLLTHQYDLRHVCPTQNAANRFSLSKPTDRSIMWENLCQTALNVNKSKKERKGYSVPIARALVCTCTCTGQTGLWPQNRMASTAPFHLTQYKSGCLHVRSHQGIAPVAALVIHGGRLRGHVPRRDGAEKVHHSFELTF